MPSFTADDITNRALGKLFSIEFMALIVGLAVTWGQFSERVGAMEDRVHEVEERQLKRIGDMADVVKNRGEKINSIEQDVAVMKNDVHHMKRSVEENKENIKEVLEILRELKKD